jgi:beta-galactosidase/beta-glucuronidase
LVFLGFNLARKHVKIEPDRWYYWCDKLGLLVWQDMPAGNNGDAEAKKQFEVELKNLVEGRWSHPAIIMWVVFNEGWGQYDTARIATWAKSYDPSRLVNAVSCGPTFDSGDIIDDHPYWIPNAPKGDGKRAIVIGEFGGRALVVPGHCISEKDVWGHPGGTVLAR